MYEDLLEKAFAELHDQITRLEKADQEPISMIILAGGGGTSPYVISRFQEHCRSKLGDKGVIVRRDSRAWTAVVRGGAVRGLESGVVVSEDTPRSYGFACHKKFEESIDDENDSFECPEGGKRGPDRMDWIVHKVIQRLSKLREADFPNREIRSRKGWK